jgi:hypothetical protein
MKTKTVMYVLGVATFFAAAVVIPVQAQEAVGADGHTETKVSEIWQNGKYVRTTEVFRDKVLLSRKREIGAHDNGKIVFISEKLFSDGEMVFASSCYPGKCTIRSYYHQGKMVVEEGDQKGDGFFDAFILFDAKEQPVEAFERNKDGKVTQFSKEDFSKLKKAFDLTEGEVK